MKKNIFISVALIVLAVLAGCTPQSNFPAFPQSVVLTQKGDFIKGQDFDASKFEIVVTYLDGSKETLKDAALTYTDKEGGTNGVSADDTVSINVGKDYNGNDVKTEVNISRVYTIDSISAVLANTGAIAVSDVDDLEDGTATADSALFVVTAKFGSNEVVLPTSAYGVTVSAEKVDGEATEVAAKATIALNSTSNIGKANTNVADCTVDVTVSKTASTPDSTVVASVNSIKSVNFEIPAFNYEGTISEDLIDTAKITVNVTYDDKKSKDVIANTVEGLEFFWADPATGEPLNGAYVSTDFTGKADSGVNINDSTVAIGATFKGEAVGNAAKVAIAQTTLKLEAAAGTVLYAGDDLADLTADDFRVLLTVGKAKTVEVPVTEDMLTIKLSTDSNSDGKLGENDVVTVTATYNGLTTSAANDVELTVKGAQYVDYTYDNMVVTLAKDFEIAKQIYNSSINNLLDSAVVSVKADKTDANGKKEKGVDVSDLVKLSYTTTAASTSAGTALEDDKDLSKLEVGSESLYIQAELEYGAESPVYASAAVEVVAPVITKVEITPTWAKDAVIGAEVTWTVKVSTADGYIDETEEITDGEYTLAGYTVAYFQNNGDASALPVAIDEEAINNIVLKLTKDGASYESAQGVNLPAGKGYVTVVLSELKAAQAEGYKPYIGDSISTRTADYSLVLGEDEKLGTEEGVTVTGTVSDADMPKITKIVPKVTNWAITDTASENTVDVYVTYRGENGVTTDKLTTQVQVTGQAWVNGALTMKLGGNALSTDSSKATVISATSYQFSNATFEGDIKGEPNYTYAVEEVAGTVKPSETGEDDAKVVTGFDISADSTAKITVTYPVKGGTNKISFYVTTIQPTEEA